jgi:hypothetical protein
VPLVTRFGLSGFDTPSIDEALVARLLAERVPGPWGIGPCLVHAPGQGHLAALLALARSKGGFGASSIALAGRDLLALRASAENVFAASGIIARCAAIPSLGYLDGDLQGLGLACVFPELCPGRDWVGEAWSFAEGALRESGLLAVATSSTEAARFLKRKCAAFSRLAELKREGRRAILFVRRVLPMRGSAA